MSYQSYQPYQPRTNQPQPDKPTIITPAQPQYGGTSLSGEDAAAHSWAGFMINRYACKKDYIDVNDAEAIMRDSYGQVIEGKSKFTREEIDKYFRSLDVDGKGRLNYDDLRILYLRERLS